MVLHEGDPEGHKNAHGHGGIQGGQQDLERGVPPALPREGEDEALWQGHEEEQGLLREEEETMTTTTKRTRHARNET